MRPFDPRLLRRSRAARSTLAWGAVFALVQAASILAFAWALAALVAGYVAVGRDGAAPPDAGPLLALLIGSALVRGTAAWAWESVGSAGAMRVKAELRRELLVAVERGAVGGRGADAGSSTGELAALAGPGLDALDDYFGRFVPQLVLTVVATPLLVAAAWIADPLSGLILVIVLPLIPIFMALIGLATAHVQRQQWDSLRRLSRGFLELVGGLATLKLFGRAERQLDRIRRLTDDYRRRTMRVLRVTFLSGFTLELAASLSVALVAVSIGLRLVVGDLGLFVGLFVLVIAPEVFLPLRNVGAAFHASAEGVTASRDAFDVLDAAAERDAEGAPSSAAMPSPPAPSRGGERGLRVRDLVVRPGGEGSGPALDLDAEPGEIVALVGESGAGKSSAFAALLGFAAAAGRIELDGAPLGRDRIAWAGQSPALVAGTVASNVRLGDEHAPEALLAEALRLAGVELDPGRTVGPGGQGLSGGQAQRVATARAVHRALARDTPILLLDEPSSALDEERELALAASLRELAARGRIVVVASHRPVLVAIADRIVRLEAAHV